MDHKLFTETFNSVFEEYGFILVSADLSELRYKLCYSRNCMDSRGKCYTGLIEFFAIVMSPRVVICRGFVKNESDQAIKLRLNLSDGLLSNCNKFRKEFVIKLLELVSIRIDNLPVEIKHRLLRLLSVRDFLNMTAVNKTWNECCATQLLWKKMFKRDFKSFYAKTDTTENWKQRYKTEYLKAKEAKRRSELWASRSLMSPAIIPALPAPFPFPQPFAPAQPPDDIFPLMPPPNFFPRHPGPGRGFPHEPFYDPDDDWF
ncbi:F-box only protein 7-like protein [Leptotrombidium deliense]|uniref:F-box only protein 7-like protein n=1 Tax=Leptotrombidium deliense TaxID=299467 RepID=A0A443SQB5_9ACAR|nr:F-box only protein 7-like protein [Leptotrombidium deliense]